MPTDYSSETPEAVLKMPQAVAFIEVLRERASHITILALEPHKSGCTFSIKIKDGGKTYKLIQNVYHKFMAVTATRYILGRLFDDTLPGTTLEVVTSSLNDRQQDLEEGRGYRIYGMKGGGPWSFYAFKEMLITSLADVEFGFKPRFEELAAKLVASGALTNNKNASERKAAMRSLEKTLTLAVGRDLTEEDIIEVYSRIIAASVMNA
jgi:hypothetical protein